MNILFILISMFFGMIFGSFFNVCIYRIPRGESINYPPSHCSACGTTLKWYDLFPVLSWVFLKGKCRYCNCKVSIQYPLVELVTGIIFSILYLKFGLTLDFAKYVFLSSILLISAIIDYKTQYVFFSVSLVGIIGGTVFTIIELVNGRSFINVILTLGIPLVILGTIIFISKKVEGIGTGDLEIFIVIALFLNPKMIFVAIFLSIILGGMVSIIKYIKGERRTYIAFVPYIALATFITILYGNEILSWYIGLIF